MLDFCEKVLNVWNLLKNLPEFEKSMADYGAKKYFVTKEGAKAPFTGTYTSKSKSNLASKAISILDFGK